MNRSAIAALVALATAAVPTSALADAVKAELRVEGGQNKALDPGTMYKTDTTTARASNECGPIENRKQKLEGPTATGIVNDAADENRKLDPFRVSDTFSFGLIVCRIGEFGAFGANKAWLYRVNHEDGTVGGDQFRLDDGDEVLWYFANFDTGANTGKELLLQAPNRAERGEQVTIRAFQFASNGARSPAEGVKVRGGRFPNTDATGRSKGKLDFKDGFDRLRATRGEDIPSAPEVVCAKGAKRCPR